MIPEKNTTNIELTCQRCRRMFMGPMWSMRCDGCSSSRTPRHKSQEPTVDPRTEEELALVGTRHGAVRVTAVLRRIYNNSRLVTCVCKCGATLNKTVASLPNASKNCTTKCIGRRP